MNRNLKCLFKWKIHLNFFLCRYFYNNASSVMRLRFENWPGTTLKAFLTINCPGVLIFFGISTTKYVTIKKRKSLLNCTSLKNHGWENSESAITYSITSKAITWSGHYARCSSWGVSIRKNLLPKRSSKT